MLPILTDQLRELLTTVAADPAASLRLGLVAPGGYGKTTLLRELARVYRDCGMEVVTDWPASVAWDRPPTTGDRLPTSGAGDWPPTTGTGDCRLASGTGDSRPTSDVGDRRPANGAGDWRPTTRTGDRRPTSGDWRLASGAEDRRPASSGRASGAGDWRAASGTEDRRPTTRTGDRLPASGAGDCRPVTGVEGCRSGTGVEGCQLAGGAEGCRAGSGGGDRQASGGAGDWRPVTGAEGFRAGAEAGACRPTTGAEDWRAGSGAEGCEPAGGGEGCQAATGAEDCESAGGAGDGRAGSCWAGTGAEGCQPGSGAGSCRARAGSCRASGEDRQVGSRAEGWQVGSGAEDWRARAEGAGDWRGVVVLVDDAHELSGAQVKMLRELGCTRLVVACRPWPRSDELTGLLHTVDRIQLSPWDVGGVRRALAALGVAESQAEAVHGLTGGVPRWVVRVGRTWSDAVVAAESMRFELESLDSDLVRYLVAARSGVGLRIDLLGSLLGRDSDGVGEVMRDARASGLLGQDGALLPLCGEAVARVVPAEQYLGVLQRLAELQLDRAEPILPFARCLLGSGATGSTVASVLETAAREVVADDPGLAAELFGAAVSAGRPLSAVVTEWARAAALAGDLDTALRLADQAILGRNPAGARVAGAAMAHRGQWARSAELYGWAGDSPFAQIASIAVGSDATVPVARAGGLPTALDGAAGLMAEGVRLSVCGSPVGALSMLVQASALLEPAGRDALLPDSPAAVAALVALHCGQLDVAESVVDGAVAGRMGGDVMRNRHTLLLAWIRMVRGRLGAAAELVDGIDIVEPRDRLFLVALEVGLARRAGDTVALRRTWTHAGECLVRHPVDLFTFLPLSEFIVAAARLRDPGRLGTAVADAFALLKRLGDPALWSAPLHWAGVQAAIITESSATTHIQALAANRTPYGAALTEAARCWVDVTASKVEPDRVQAAAVALLEAGLWWDSARLASEAAIRTSDRKAMVGLLDCARQLQAKQQQIRQPVHRPLIAQQATSPLSEREREVADLVVQGLTYKQIGDKLFISAKTVEHHMARIRHRLGASNRSELITQLRALSGQ